MSQAYLTKRDVDMARVLKQVTKIEVKELMKVVNKSSKQKRVGNIILHSIV